jgi:hypothetical protein
MGNYSAGVWLPGAEAQKTTKILLVVGAALYLLWDIFAINNAAGDTISEVSINEMWLHPCYTLMLGGLFGHFTWPAVLVRSTRKSLSIVLPVILALGLWDHFIPITHHVWPLWPFLAGIPIGHYLYPQSVYTEQTGGLKPQ